MMKKVITAFILLSLAINSHPQKDTFSTLNKENNMNYSILVLYQATNQWLTLTREERTHFFGNKIAPIIQKFESKLTIKLFDSEAFHAKTSDFMLIECHNLKHYYYFMEYLKDTELFSKPYIILNDIIIGIENGFQDFENNKYNNDKK